MLTVREVNQTFIQLFLLFSNILKLLFKQLLVFAKDGDQS